MRLMRAIAAQKTLKNWLAERDHRPVHGLGDDKFTFFAILYSSGLALYSYT